MAGRDHFASAVISFDGAGKHHFGIKVTILPYANRSKQALKRL
jgi:hypothetical protein